MEDVLIIVLLLLFSGFIYLAFKRWSSKKSYRHLIEPRLNKYGLKYISDESSGFNTGPFPRIEIKIGAPQIRIGGMNLDRTEYRIVVIENANGEQGEIWAKIDLSPILSPKIEFRPPLDEVSSP